MDRRRFARPSHGALLYLRLPEIPKAWIEIPSTEQQRLAAARFRRAREGPDPRHSKLDRIA